MYYWLKSKTCCIISWSKEQTQSCCASLAISQVMLWMSVRNPIPHLWKQARKLSLKSLWRPAEFPKSSVRREGSAEGKWNGEEKESSDIILWHGADLLIGEVWASWFSLQPGWKTSALSPKSGVSPFSKNMNVSLNLTKILRFLCYLR